MQKGDKVHYTPNLENGIIKSVDGNYAYVVYKWGEDEKNYEDYTGVRTPLQSLKKGWVPGRVLPEFKEGYYYLHTNGSLIYKPFIVTRYDPNYFESPFVAKLYTIRNQAEYDKMVSEVG